VSIDQSQHANHYTMPPPAAVYVLETVILCTAVQKLCGVLLFRDKDLHYSRSCYWLPLLIGIPYALASVSRICAVYYGK